MEYNSYLSILSERTGIWRYHHVTVKKIRGITIAVVAGVLLLIAASGIYQVQQGEQAVVLTFGKASPDTAGSGLHWRIPFVQSVKIQSTQHIYTCEYGFKTTQAATTTTKAQYQEVPEEAIMLTSDENIVEVEVVYQVKVTDPAAFFYKVDDPFGTMQCAFETVLRRNVQNRTLDEALLAKEEIAAQVLPDFQAVLKPYNLGVTVTSVMIQNISVPQEASAAYADVINAQTEKTKNLDDAEKYKNQVVPNAKAQAYKMEQDAQAYAAKKLADAQGDVAEFNAVYANYVSAKDITRKRLLIETLQSILAGANKVYIMDDSSGALKLLNLTDTSAAPTPTPAPEATATPVATPTPQPTSTEGGN